MHSDFELKPTTTYDAEKLRELLGSLPRRSRGQVAAMPSSMEEANAPVVISNAVAAPEPGVEEPCGADEVVDRYLAEQPATPPMEAPLSYSFAAWQAQLAAERQLAQSRVDGYAEEQADFADELDEHGRNEAARGAFAMARALLEKAVEIRRRLFGERDPKRILSYSWLGSLALQQGELEQAEWLYGQAHAAAVGQLGPEHPRTASTLHNLGLVALRRGDIDRASDLYEQALAIKLQHVGWDQPTVAATLTNLGNLARQQQNLRAAMEYYARARDIYERTLGGVNPGLATALMGMGRVHLALGQIDEARFVLERALRIREALDVTPAQLAGARLLLAQAMRRAEPDQARALLARALREYEASPHPQAERVQALREWLERM